ncbi:MAG TPA: DUF559 domain-containing protein, partial [Burkholderiales bacterium]|nr:DUF559 domain-containing protein [Burkholderiales bacterium]
IEVDGDSHFDEAGAQRDRVRTDALSSRGIHLLRFTNAEVLQTFEAVRDRIYLELKQSQGS